MQSTQTEIWLPIAGWDGLYEVSDLGRIRSLRRLDSVGRTVAGRIMRPSKHKKGYRFVCLGRDATKTYLRVHRVVLTAFVGACPEGMEGCHNDGNLANNRLANLRWDTPSSNTKDKVTHGTHNEARKDSCPRGHDLVAPNLVASKVLRGARECLACSRSRRKGQGVDQEIADEKYEQIMGTN